MLQAITIHFFCKAITKNHDFLFSATVNCYQGRVTVLTVMYVRGRESAPVSEITCCDSRYWIRWSMNEFRCTLSATLHLNRAALPLLDILNKTTPLHLLRWITPLPVAHGTIKWTLRDLARSSGSSGYFLPSVFGILWNWTYYSSTAFHHQYSIYIIIYPK